MSGERLPIAYEFAAAQIRSGNSVLVHCRQGKDRTGLFMAYFLQTSFRVSPVEAVRRVKEVRPIAFTAERWDLFVRRRSYTEDFKRDAVAVVTDHGCSCAAVGRSLGIDGTLIGRWKQELEARFCPLEIKQHGSAH